MSKLPKNTLPHTSRLGSDAFFEGKIAFTKALEISGRVSGEMESDSGFLDLGTSARLDARVVVHTLRAKGQVCGDIICHHQCVLQDGALVKGIVISPTVEVSSGVSFDGEINMFSPVDDIKVMELSPQQAHEKICQQALNIHDDDVRKRYGIHSPPPATSPSDKPRGRWRKKNKSSPEEASQKKIRGAAETKAAQSPQN